MDSYRRLSKYIGIFYLSLMVAWLGGCANKKDLKDIPPTVLKELEIVLVEHMDEVLPHSLVLNEGDALFKKSDMHFDIMQKEVDLEQPSALI